MKLEVLCRFTRWRKGAPFNGGQVIPFGGGGICMPSWPQWSQLYIILLNWYPSVLPDVWWTLTNYPISTTHLHACIPRRSGRLKTRSYMQARTGTDILGKTILYLYSHTTSHTANIHWKEHVLWFHRQKWPISSNSAVWSSQHCQHHPTEWWWNAEKYFRAWAKPACQLSAMGASQCGSNMSSHFRYACWVCLVTCRKLEVVCIKNQIGVSRTLAFVCN